MAKIFPLCDTHVGIARRTSRMPGFTWNWDLIENNAPIASGKAETLEVAQRAIETTHPGRHPQPATTTEVAAVFDPQTLTIEQVIKAVSLLEDSGAVDAVIEESEQELTGDPNLVRDAEELPVATEAAEATEPTIEEPDREPAGKAEEPLSVTVEPTKDIN